MNKLIGNILKAICDFIWGNDPKYLVVNPQNLIRAEMVTEQDAFTYCSPGDRVIVVPMKSEFRCGMYYKDWV